MTPESVLIELLERIGAQNGAPALISEHELSSWPSTAVTAIKKQGLLIKTRPATSTVCPGCEHMCAMPVHILTAEGRDSEGFIVCDKPSGINRVPISVSRLEQWQATGDSIADLLAGLLGLHRSGANGSTAARWEIGMLKGVKHSSHLVLTADNRLTLTLAGHSISLADVLTIDGSSFKVDRKILDRLVDQPAAGAGDTESATQRRLRLKKRVKEAKIRGIKGFLKAVATEEGISSSRLKQILKEKPTSPKSQSDW